mmetsp:Transcript_35774/g.93595  ORF Transcript_35774/g.93595 Transcript_35774/m.93595 type:complete len:195 (+) Transcript_35774:162-746(+)
MKFILDFFYGVLQAIGLAGKSGTLVLLGLDDAGKTTLLHMLKSDRVIQPAPTLHPSSEELSVGGVSFTTYDLGGHWQARKVWHNYFPVVDGIVYIVDTASPARFEESKDALDELLKDEAIVDVPILVLGNKIDKRGATSEETLKAALGLVGQTTGKAAVPRSQLPGRPLEVFTCSVKRRQGYGDGFRWLSNYVC